MLSVLHHTFISDGENPQDEASSCSICEIPVNQTNKDSKYGDDDNVAIEFATTEEVIEEARRGRMFILVDDQDRENEGDLVCPAQMITPEIINFMAKNGRGLICLSLTKECVDKLNLRLIQKQNIGSQTTAFTVSIEAKEGVTTGISAQDRTHTIKTAIDPDKDYRDIVSPGHVMPLLSQDGGVLTRAGHTEASVEISRLANLHPSSVICEIMNDDGTMARRADLIKFAKEHDLKIGTIADLIRYRLQNECLIEHKYTMLLDTKYGGHFKGYLFKSLIESKECLALVKGQVNDGKPVPFKLHTIELINDILGGFYNSSSNTLQDSMALVKRLKRGIILLSQPKNDRSMVQQFVTRDSKMSVSSDQNIKNNALYAYILSSFGVKRLINLDNTNTSINGLEDFGLQIVNR